MFQRYFRAVLRDGQRIVTAVTVKQTGSFNLDPAGERWKPFAAGSVSPSYEFGP